MIIIVGCGHMKQTEPAPALWLYTSGYLGWCRKWSLSVAPTNRIWVLSAKHGLIPSTKVIAPYSATFRTSTAGWRPPSTPLEPAVRPEVTATQIRAAGIAGEVIVLAGADYYKHLSATGTNLDPWNPFTQNVPDKRYGHQMHGMKHSVGRIPERIRP